MLTVKGRSTAKRCEVWPPAQLEDGHFRRGGSGFRIQYDATPNPSVWLAGELLDGGWGDRGEEVDEVAVGVAEQQ